MELLPFLPHGNAVLGDAAFVMGDEGIGRIDDIARAAVVPLQAEDPGFLEILLEVEDIGDLGAAEGVDGLGIVPHHAEIPVRRRQFAEDDVLGQVRVLVLVHQDMAETAGDGIQRRLVVPEEDVQVEEDVVEVHDARLAALAAVFGIDPVDFRFLVPGVLFSVAPGTVHVRGGRHQVVLGLGDAAEHLFWLVQLVVQA